MSKKAILLCAPAGLGALLLLWVSSAGKVAEPPKSARAPRPATPRRVEPPAPAETTVTESVPWTPATRPAATTPAAGDENALIRTRLEQLESKLKELELKRTALQSSNQDLEKQVSEKMMEASWRMMAEARVRGWEGLLGLSEAQKQSFSELWMSWMRDDAGRPQSREIWLSREPEIRSRLSVEQSAKLHDSVSLQSQRMWSSMGQTIGGMVGAGKEDQVRIQQTLGSYSVPAPMLLQEAYGADWPGQLKDASTQLQSVLSPEQMARLERFVRR